MKLSLRHLAAIVEVETTADIARLGRRLMLFCALVIAATGSFVDTARWTSDVRWIAPVAGFLGVLAVVSRWLPWHRWERTTTLAFPLLSFVALAAVGRLPHDAAATYVALFVVWFVFIGISQLPWMGWAFSPLAAIAWWQMVGVVDPQRLVRLVLAVLVWGVLANVLAVRAVRAESRTLQLARQAETDPLTGLPNRRTLENALLGLVPGDVVVVVDLDHFKEVNDRGGHAYGDQVLADFAQTLMTVVRGTDLVARYGGEEFVLILASNTAFGLGAASVMARLRGGWSQLYPDITWSAGASCHSQFGDPHATLRDADRALYEAKTTGRNRVVASDNSRELAGVALGPSTP